MVKDGNDDDDKEDVMGVLPPLVARRVERLKCLNTERDRAMKKYLEERAAPDTKYLDLCRPLYEERGNVVARRLNDDIGRIHNKGGGKKEEEWSKIYENGGGDDAGEKGEGGCYIPGGFLQRQ